MIMNTKLIITGLAFISLSVFVSAQENSSKQEKANIPARGAAYVDANNDGICDNFNTEKAKVTNKGKKGNGNRTCNGQGPGRGRNQGQGRSAGFVDADKNGICDRAEDPMEK
jgi:hypothetical protein